MKTAKQEALQQAIENLSIILQDEDLTDEKLRYYSEGLLPNTQDLLIKALKQDEWIRIESEQDLPKEDGQYFVYSSDRFPRIDTFSGRLSNAIHHITGNPIFSHYQPIKKPDLPIY
jgi:hypothetical protein